MTTLFETIAEAKRHHPVDVAGLATRVGIPVKPMRLPEDVSGALVKVGPDKYEIHVNALHPATRRRFTIAHELGHYVQHRSLLGNGTNDNRAYRTTRTAAYYNSDIGPRQETEANRFAASLLMPDEIVARMRLDGATIDQMADALQVSRHAMSIREGVPFER